MADPLADPSLVPLPALGHAQAAATLAPPFVPALAAERVRLALRAAASRVPVLLIAPGALHLRLARALHAEAGLAGPLVLAADTHPTLQGLPANATAVVDVGSLAPGAHAALAAILDDGAAWVIATLRPGESLTPALQARLTAVTLDVPSLDARPADIAPLAAAIIAERAARAGRPAPALTPSALATLAAAAWPGDIVELESVLTRAYLLAGDDPIDAHHFALEAVAPPAPPEVPSPASPHTPDPYTVELAYVVGELAHDLRNPFVPIKTYVDNLDEVLASDALRTQFTTLVREAIDRMDGPLANALAFTHLGTPRQVDVDLGRLVSGVLEVLAADDTLPAARVQCDGPLQGHCTSDPDHLEYGLSNLLQGLARETPPAELLHVGLATNGVVTIRITVGPSAAPRVRALLKPAEYAVPDDPTLLPLVFTLARAALARCGVGLGLEPEADGSTTIVVRIPTMAVNEE